MSVDDEILLAVTKGISDALVALVAKGVTDGRRLDEIAVRVGAAMARGLAYHMIVKSQIDDMAEKISGE